MAGYDQSLLYHSIRIYDGTIARTENVGYRIGNSSRTVQHQIEKYYDTWDNFRFIPAERPTITMPKSNTKIVTVPGRKNPIDMTTYLTGHPTYGNRTGSWSFLTDNDWVDSHGGWIAYDKMLRGLFNGHVAKISLRDDPSYFYAGELTMGQWNTGDSRSSVSITYNLYPYKKSHTSSMELWEWDDFDFQDGVIQYLKDLQVSESRIVNIIGSPERISPHIQASAQMYVDKRINDTWITYGYAPTQDITGNKSVIPRLVIEDGVNQIRFRGTGTVSIDYRRGLL